MHWLWVLWFGYTWPSLKGNGPEAAAQTIIYAAAAYLLLPPIRTYIDSHVKSIHAKMDHIIKHHPDIPDFEEPDGK